MKRRCITDWVRHLASEYEAEEDGFEFAPLRTSLQKVKTLMRGDAVTLEEVNRVANAPNEEEAMQALYRSWASGDAFERKMIEFFKVNLQQKLNHLRPNNLTGCESLDRNETRFSGYWKSPSPGPHCIS